MKKPKRNHNEAVEWMQLQLRGFWADLGFEQRPERVREWLGAWTLTALLLGLGGPKVSGKSVYVWDGGRDRRVLPAEQ